MCRVMIACVIVIPMSVCVCSLFFFSLISIYRMQGFRRHPPIEVCPCPGLLHFHLFRVLLLFS
jgi:hypothetical protein